MERVLIGFGSNQGDSPAICREAVTELGRHPDVRIVKVSSLYRTQPVGMTDQDWFINGAILLETELEPEQLLRLLQQVEAAFGRVRRGRWGPRTLDLDILFFGTLEADTGHLAIPHPRLHERRFVLEPLKEIAPDWIHPRLGISVRDLAGRLALEHADQQVQQLDMTWSASSST